jgi:hypothetical protein
MRERLMTSEVIDWDTSVLQFAPIKPEAGFE